MEYISGGDLQTFLRQRRCQDLFLEPSSPQHNRELLPFGDHPGGHGINHMSFTNPGFTNPGFTHDHPPFNHQPFNHQPFNHQQSNSSVSYSPERNVSTKIKLAPTRSADSVNSIKNPASPLHRADAARHGSIQTKKNSANRQRSDTISLIRIDSTSDTASTHGDDSVPDTPIRHSEINFTTSGDITEPRSEPQPDCDVTGRPGKQRTRENDLHENGHRKLRLTNRWVTLKCTDFRYRLSHRPLYVSIIMGILKRWLKLRHILDQLIIWFWKEKPNTFELFKERYSFMNKKRLHTFDNNTGLFS